jgi:hypothetical protein
MNRQLVVGDVVSLRKPCLNNEAGTLGIVYYDYTLGVQVIFQNGEYDGFSTDEQQHYLNYVDHNVFYEKYVFTNVIKLSRDFDSGYFKISLQSTS